MKKRRVWAMLLCVTMIVSMIPASAFAETGGTISKTEAVFADMPADWSTAALQNAVNNGLISGSSVDGKHFIKPNDSLTRAEMGTILNNAFGAEQKASLTGVTDVAASAWYYDQMAKAMQMGSFAVDKQLRPEAFITRQETATVLAKVFKLQEAKTTALDSFTDKTSVAAWAKGYVASMAENGYMAGSNGKLNPTGNITRAEFAAIMNNMVAQYIKTAGTVSEVVAKGNVMINVPGVTLKNVTVNGNLILGDGIGSGDVTLDNVKVTGETVVRGGGVKSFIVKGNSDLGTIIIAKVDGNVRVSVEGNAKVDVIEVADGKNDVIVEGTVAKLVVEGAVPVVAQKADIKTIEINAPKAELTVDKNSKVGTVAVAKEASSVTVAVSGTVTTVKTEGAKTEVKAEAGAKITKVEATKDASAPVITVAKDAKIETVTTAAPKTEVKGEGTVNKVEAKEGADNSKVTTPGTTVSADKNTEGVIAGSGSDAIEVKPGGSVSIGGGSNSGSSGGSTRYTVQFDLNVGGGTIASQTIASGGKVTEPAEPTSTGAIVFLGWYDGSAKWDFEKNTVSKSLTLTAKWVVPTQVTDEEELEVALTNTSAQAIIITKDITITKSHEINREVTICGDGEKPTITHDGNGLRFRIRNSVKMQNLNFDSSKIEGQFITVYKEASLTMVDCNIEATNPFSRGVSLNEENAVLVLKGTKIDVDYYGIVVANKNQSVTVAAESEITAWAAIMTTAGGPTDPVPTVYANWNGNITVENSTLIGRSISNEGYGTLILQENTPGFTVNLKNSTIKTEQVDPPLTGQMQAAIVIRSFGNTINITDCTLTDELGDNIAKGGTLVCQYNYYAVKDYNGEGQNNTINIAGGSVKSLAGQKPFTLRSNDKLALDNVTVNEVVRNSLEASDYILLPDSYADLERGNRGSLNNVPVKIVSEAFTMPVDLCIGGRIGGTTNPALNIEADITVPAGVTLSFDSGVVLSGANHIKGDGAIDIYGDGTQLKQALEDSKINNIVLMKNTTLVADTEIPKGKTLTIAQNVKLTVPSDKKLYVNGTLNGGGTVVGTITTKTDDCQVSLDNITIAAGTADAIETLAAENLYLNIQGCKISTTGYVVDTYVSPSLGVAANMVIRDTNITHTGSGALFRWPNNAASKVLFGADVTGLPADETKIFKTPSTAKVTLNKDGDFKYYTSFGDAVSEGSEGVIAKALTDIAEMNSGSIPIPVTESITIDLNGKKVAPRIGESLPDCTFRFEGNGYLTLKDTSQDQTGMLQAKSSVFQSEDESKVNFGALYNYGNTVSTKKLYESYSYEVDNNSIQIQGNVADLKVTVKATPIGGGEKVTAAWLKGTMKALVKNGVEIQSVNGEGGIYTFRFSENDFAAFSDAGPYQITFGYDGPEHHAAAMTGDSVSVTIEESIRVSVGFGDTDIPLNWTIIPGYGTKTVYKLPENFEPLQWNGTDDLKIYIQLPSGITGVITEFVYEKPNWEYVRPLKNSGDKTNVPIAAGEPYVITIAAQDLKTALAHSICLELTMGEAEFHYIFTNHANGKVKLFILTDPSVQPEAKLPVIPELELPQTDTSASIDSLIPTAPTDPLMPEPPALSEGQVPVQPESETELPTDPLTPAGPSLELPPAGQSAPTDLSK